MTNVPAFVYAASEAVKVGTRQLRVDIAFGGAFYAIVDTSDGHSSHLRAAARAAATGYRYLLVAGIGAQHPADPKLAGIAASSSPARRRIRRRTSATSPSARRLGRPVASGTGTSAVMAVLDAMGLLPDGQPFVHEGLSGSLLRGRIAGRLPHRRHRGGSSPRSRARPGSPENTRSCSTTTIRSGRDWPLGPQARPTRRTSKMPRSVRRVLRFERLAAWRVTWAHPAPFSYLDVVFKRRRYRGHARRSRHRRGARARACRRAAHGASFVGRAAASALARCSRHDFCCVGSAGCRSTWTEPRAHADEQAIDCRIGFPRRRLRRGDHRHESVSLRPDHQTFINVYEGNELGSSSSSTHDPTQHAYYRGTTQGAIEVMKTFIPSGIAPHPDRPRSHPVPRRAAAARRDVGRAAEDRHRVHDRSQHHACRWRRSTS